MNRAERISGVIDRGALLTGAGVVAAFTVMIVYVVASRYLLSSTPRWAEELPRLCLVWLTFIGTVSAFMRGTHFRAGLLQLIVPEGVARRGFCLLAALCSGIFLAVLGWNGWKLTLLTWPNQTTALSMPVGLFYLALPVTCAFALLGLVLVGWRR